MHYTIKRISGEDFDLLVPLMKDAFGMDADLEYFRWKFLKNPAGQFIGFAAFSDQKECAAYYGVIPELYVLNGKDRIIYQACDGMTHSKHRRKGLFQELLNHCNNYLRERDELFVIGFGGEVSTTGLIKCGWRSIFSITYLFRLNAQAFFNCFLKKVSPLKGYSFETFLDNAVIVELRKGNPKPLIRQAINVEFMDWRLGNPRYQYHKLAIFKERIIVGYFIYYFETGKIILFDYYLRDRADAKALIYGIDLICLQNKSKGIVTLAQQHSEFTNLLTSNGFLINNLGKGPLAVKRPFILLAKEEELLSVQNETLWEVTPIYHDSL